MYVCIYIYKTQKRITIWFKWLSYNSFFLRLLVKVELTSKQASSSQVTLSSDSFLVHYLTLPIKWTLIFVSVNCGFVVVTFFLSWSTFRSASDMQLSYGVRSLGRRGHLDPFFMDFLTFFHSIFCIFINFFLFYFWMKCISTRFCLSTSLDVLLCTYKLHVYLSWLIDDLSIILTLLFFCQPFWTLILSFNIV